MQDRTSNPEWVEKLILMLKEIEKEKIEESSQVVQDEESRDR